jgi:hypothetical protein
MNIHGALRSENMNNGKRSNKDNLRSRHKNSSSKDNLRSSNKDNRNKDNLRFNNQDNNLRREVSSRKRESRNLRLSNQNTLSLKKNLKAGKAIKSSGKGDTVRVLGFVITSYADVNRGGGETLEPVCVK